jgi:hypothetical protein
MEGCLVQYHIQPVRMIQDWIDKQLAVLPRAEHAAITERMNTLRYASSRLLVTPSVSALC